MSSGIWAKHHVLELPQGPVSVYEAGEENAPPVLLLHGAMLDEARLIWYHLAPFLARSRRVLSLDFPRHGRSRPWTGTVNQDCLNQVVGDVIKYFALPPLPLIGLSMGGGVSIAYALKNPSHVTGVVLMGPGGLGDTVQHQFLTWLLIRTPGLLPCLTRYYASMSPAKMRTAMAKLLHEGENTLNFDDIVTLSLAEAKQKWEYREKPMDDWQLEGIGPFKLKVNYLPELNRLTCPTLILRGENDPLIKQVVMEEATRALPNGRLVVIQNAGHLLPLEQPDVVDNLVQDFLAEHHL